MDAPPRTLSHLGFQIAVNGGLPSTVQFWWSAQLGDAYAVLYAGQEAKVRTGHGTTDWFQIGKGVCQGRILSPCLLLGRKVMTNPESILKSRDISLPTTVYLVKAMVFPVVMYGCESWTIKKAKCRRIDAFELLCWRRLLRVPWTARKSNRSILKEISLEFSLEGLMLKLKLNIFPT